VEMQNGKHVAAIFAFCSRDAYATFPVAAMPTAALPAPRRLWQRPHAAAPCCGSAPRTETPAPRPRAPCGRGPAPRRLLRAP